MSAKASCPTTQRDAGGETLSYPWLPVRQACPELACSTTHGEMERLLDAVQAQPNVLLLLAPGDLFGVLELRVVGIGGMVGEIIARIEPWPTLLLHLRLEGQQATEARRKGWARGVACVAGRPLGPGWLTMPPPVDEAERLAIEVLVLWALDQHDRRSRNPA